MSDLLYLRVTERRGGCIYYSSGDCRNSTGILGTDKLFTGQRLDDTGLYYYNARYYDPGIGRFISADTIVPNPMNPQSLNRYTYCLNNPLKYVDPSGHYNDDFYYEQLCEANGIDPDDGLALFTGDGGEVIGTVKISEFVSWVDDTPEKFDYISQSASQQAVGASLQGLGIESVMSYHMNLTAAPIALVELGRNSIPKKTLNFIGIGAITINPYIFFSEGDIPASSNPLGSRIGKEEYYHILQQRHDPNFYRNYISEYLQGLHYYHNHIEAYSHISYEQTAKMFAGFITHYEQTPYNLEYR